MDGATPRENRRLDRLNESQGFFCSSSRAERASSHLMPGATYPWMTPSQIGKVPCEGFYYRAVPLTAGTAAVLSLNVPSYFSHYGETRLVRRTLPLAPGPPGNEYAPDRRRTGQTDAQRKDTETVLRSALSRTDRKGYSGDGTGPRVHAHSKLGEKRKLLSCVCLRKKRK
ncbi:hypothetical protein AAFF_G00199330 [Aldrovandia affinis]|uniref:Uncharacterized protein n=1 Tax=Aldrovandia affinis TaxID=143900 RepID=A0AAD7RIW5_9TELE|nr:hypothetical protein AAFF_G00199330 [Aldrovandia affinis]